MGASEDRDKLSHIVEGLRLKFNDVDVNCLNDEETIETMIDEIVDVNVQIQQFKTRHGVNDWNSWGPPKWANLERIWAGLDRKLRRIQRKHADKDRTFNKWATVWTVFWAAVSALAALVSLYLGIKS